MSDYVTNQLFFPSNAKTILSHLKSKAAAGHSPAQFSLNSIKALPPQLMTPPNQSIRKLAEMNIGMRLTNDAIRKMIGDQTLQGKASKPDESDIRQAIKETEAVLDGPELEIVQQAVDNYDQLQFFCSFDWCLVHWGTPENIHSTVASTFEEPTSFIEFETLQTPPLIALQLLADTFPSVRFRLSYRYRSQDPWTKTEIFPITPFGY